MPASFDAPIIDQPTPLARSPRLTVLATWMSNCVYAYSADLTPQNRPWSESEYFDLRSSQKPSTRAVIWAGKNVGLTADIVLSVTPLWMMSLQMRGEDPDGAPAAACAWLSANTSSFTLSGGHRSEL